MSCSSSRRCQAQASQQGERSGGTAPPGVLNPEECSQFPLVLQKILQKVEHLFPACHRRTWFPLILEKCCNAVFKLLFWPQVNISMQVRFSLGSTVEATLWLFSSTQPYFYHIFKVKSINQRQTSQGSNTSNMLKYVQLHIFKALNLTFSNPSYQTVTKSA